MRRNSVAIALIGVVFMLIGGWQVFGPVRAAQADSPTVTPTPLPAAIGGIVQDNTTFFPIAGANVAAIGSVTAVATTDPSGSYTLNALTSGEYNVTASQIGYQSQSQLVSASSGVTSAGNFHLAALTPTSTITPTPIPGSINGVVQDSTTFHPISGASIAAVGTVTAVATTDPSGSYSLVNLAPGAYDVAASQAGYATQHRQVGVVSGVTSVGNFQLAGLAVTLTSSPTVTPGGNTIPIPPTVTQTPTPAGPISVSIYLPILIYEYTATPTPTDTATVTPTVTPTFTDTVTPTVTVTPCNGSVQVVQNGSFENGLDQWSTTGVPEVSSVEYTDGTHSLLLGGYNWSNDAVTQPIAVPTWAASAAVYASWWMLTTEYSPDVGYDDLQINVFDPTSQLLTQTLVWNTAPQQVWTDVRQDIPNIAQYRGSTLTLNIAGLTDHSLVTLWYVDNVRVVFACGTTPAYERVATPTPTPTATGGAT